MKMTDIFKGIKDPKLFWWNIHNMLKELQKDTKGLERSLGLPDRTIFYYDQLKKVLWLEQQLNAIAFACDISRPELVKWVSQKFATVQVYEKKKKRAK